MQAELDQGGRARLLYDPMRLDISNVNLHQAPRTEAQLSERASVSGRRPLRLLLRWWAVTDSDNRAVSIN